MVLSSGRLSAVPRQPPSGDVTCLRRRFPRRAYPRTQDFFFRLSLTKLPPLCGGALWGESLARNPPAHVWQQLRGGHQIPILPPPPLSSCLHPAPCLQNSFKGNKLEIFHPLNVTKGNADVCGEAKRVQGIIMYKSQS